MYAYQFAKMLHVSDANGLAQQVANLNGQIVIAEAGSGGMANGLRDAKAGLDMAKVALSLNPCCSSELWNTLGDCLLQFGRVPEAKQAYLRALGINVQVLSGRVMPTQPDLEDVEGIPVHRLPWTHRRWARS